MNTNKRVKRILLRNSSMLQIFFSVLNNFFTDAERFKYVKQKRRIQHAPLQVTENQARISIEPPAASIAAFAFSLTAFTLKVNLPFTSPLPNIFTLSFWAINLLL